MKYRKLRIAWYVSWGVICLLFVVLCVRSYEWIDRLRVYNISTGSLEFRSYNGRLLLFVCDNSTNSRGDVRGLDRSGLRLIGWSPSNVSPVDIVSYAPTEFTRTQIDAAWGFSKRTSGGWLVVAPQWLVILLASALGCAPAIRRDIRFSLRMLLMATTIAAVLLYMATR